MKNKTKQLFKLLIGKWRMLFGFCPKCNSDAPEIDTCNVCDYKNNYNSKFGRTKKQDREFWWARFLNHLND